MNRSRKLVFLCLFFVSGACGLIYEIIWSRLLVFVFGGTTFAISTVLSCFMGGLALGSFLAGRLSHKIDRPERTYGLLEIGIGLYCLAIPFLFDMALPVYKALADISSNSFFLLTTARVVVCGLMLLIPTTLMGATLPLLSKAFVRRPGQMGGAVARLYGINTIGAFAGCAAAGFILLPTIGLSRSILLAATLNILAGIVAIVIAKGPIETDAAKEEKKKKPAIEKVMLECGPAIMPGALLWLYGLSGFAAMAFQVSWSRALILSMGASTYAFSAIVACFILGIAIGSLLISGMIKKMRSPLGIAGLMECLIGLSALLVAPFFGQMPSLVNKLSLGEDTSFTGILTIEILCVLGLLIIPTLCMGALMPVICVIFEAIKKSSARPSAGKSVGTVYASNSLGTIIGSAMAGFIMLPFIGMQWTIIIASALSGIIGAAFIINEKAWQKKKACMLIGVIWIAGISLGIFSPRWSREAMVSGPYLGREPGNIKDILFYEEGIDTTVAITASIEGSISLRVNGKPDASDSMVDAYSQIMLAHLPLTLKPDAEDVCVIGLGSGITSGAALSHSVKTVDTIEISKAVIKASEYFSHVTNEILKDPRMRIHRADGRNFLLMTDKKYDVIISEPSNPWISGVANLFTKEFFQLSKARLKPGGIHCQWIQSYSIKAEDFANVINTLKAVFEHLQIWEMAQNDYLIVCSDNQIPLDIEKIYFASQQPNIKSMMSNIKINDPMQLAHHYIAGYRDIRQWVEDKKILIDDRPHLEFSAPSYLLKDDCIKIAGTLDSHKGMPSLKGNQNSTLNAEFLERIRNSRMSRKILNVDFQLAYDRGDLAATLDSLLRIAALAPTDYRMIQYLDIALNDMRKTKNVSILPMIDEAYSRIGELTPMSKTFDEVSGEDNYHITWPFENIKKQYTDPEYKSLNDEVVKHFNDKDFEKALEKVKITASKYPYDATTQLRAGAWSLDLRDHEQAIGYLLKAWVIAPAEPNLNFNLARAYFRRGDIDRALYFLEIAFDNGYNDRSKIERSELFQGLKGDTRFMQLLSTLPGSN
jgi:spermidine synthase